MKRTLLFVLICCVLVFSFCELLIWSFGQTVTDKEPLVLIVPGAKIIGNQPAPSLLSRLSLARDYLQAHPKALAIVTGGKGEDEIVSEASVMRDWLVAQGIDPERILLEDKSRNTLENMTNAQKILQDNELGTKVGIITNDFHMLRSVMLAQRVGLQAEALPSNTPESYVLAAYLREFFALIKSFLLDRGE